MDLFWGVGGTNSTIAPGPKKTAGNIDQIGWSQDLPDVYRLLGSSPALSPTGSSYMRSSLIFGKLETFHATFRVCSFGPATNVLIDRNDWRLRTMRFKKNMMLSINFV